MENSPSNQPATAEQLAEWKALPISKRLVNMWDNHPSTGWYLGNAQKGITAGLSRGMPKEINFQAFLVLRYLFGLQLPKLPAMSLRNMAEELDKKTFISFRQVKLHQPYVRLSFECWYAWAMLLRTADPGFAFGAPWGAFRLPSDELFTYLKAVKILARGAHQVSDQLLIQGLDDGRSGCTVSGLLMPRLRMFDWVKRTQQALTQYQIATDDPLTFFRGILSKIPWSEESRNAQPDLSDQLIRIMDEQLGLESEYLFGTDLRPLVQPSPAAPAPAPVDPPAAPTPAAAPKVRRLAPSKPFVPLTWDDLRLGDDLTHAVLNPDQQAINLPVAEVPVRGLGMAPVPGQGSRPPAERPAPKDYEGVAAGDIPYVAPKMVRVRTEVWEYFQVCAAAARTRVCKVRETAGNFHFTFTPLSLIDDPGDCFHVVAVHRVVRLFATPEDQQVFYNLKIPREQRPPPLCYFVPADWELPIRQVWQQGDVIGRIGRHITLYAAPGHPASSAP